MQPTAATIHYPDSDGKPMADNTLQYRWLVTIKDNLEALFTSREDVFVAGNLLWYPVELKRGIRQGPDVFVVFGRPKGERGSYQQWLEAGVAPQVVFEILSPGNRAGELHRKFLFYQRYGVQEYYIYNPDTGALQGWQRGKTRLAQIRDTFGFSSPLLGIRFYPVANGEMRLFKPNGEPFLTFVELTAKATAEKQRADDEKQRADQATQAAMNEKQRADQAIQLAEDQRQRADDEKQRADDEKQRADQAIERARRLAERLRSLGMDVDE